MHHSHIRLPTPPQRLDCKRSVTDNRLCVGVRLNLQVGFRRELDGRVSLKGQDGHWFWVKSDMQASGCKRRRQHSLQGATA